MGQIGQYTVFKSVGLGSLISVITASWGYLKKNQHESPKIPGISKKSKNRQVSRKNQQGLTVF
jgi:hypothetical protein